MDNLTPPDDLVAPNGSDFASDIRNVGERSAETAVDACRNGHLTPRRNKSGKCCECDSGKHKRYRAKNLGKVLAADRLYSKNRPYAIRKAWFEFHHLKKPWQRSIHKARARAKKRGVEFDLTIEWAAARWTGKCEITGLPFDAVAGKGNGPRQFSPSIDRIDNSRGYVQGNCRFILAGVNALKSSGTDAEMLIIAKALVAALGDLND